MDECDALRNVKTLLVEKGWTQGTFRNSDGKYCLVGAIDTIVYSQKIPHREQDMLYLGVVGKLNNVIREGEGLVGWLSVWNDKEGRTKEEVLSVIDKACA